MLYGNRRILFKNYEFYATENVYAPAEDSFLFAENLSVQKTDIVLDMGTGCGILGIIAAKKAAEVFAIDVNPFALQCARKNALLNGVADKMSFIRGDLFTALDTGRKFTLIIFNSPYLPVENEDHSWLGFAWSGGAGGREIINRFIADATEHLNLKGEILLMQSSLSGIEETLHSFEGRGMTARVVVSCDLTFFETLALVSARLK